MAALSPLDRAIRAARRGHTEAARRLLDDILAAEPNDEAALAWRARIEDDPAVRRGLLDRVLAISPDARWAHDAVAALGDTEAATATRGSLDDVGRQAATIHHLQCPNCGGQVEIHPERGTKAVRCTHCGSVLDVSKAQAEIIGRIKLKKSWKPKKDILPGAEFVHDGERHLVTGWLQYKGWDSEDSWFWDEWQLVSDTGAVRYLSYSPDEGFLLQTPLHPMPRATRSGIELPEGRVRFHEVSRTAITAMAGELTWRPRLGATLQTAEGRKGGVHYSAELTADEVEVVAGPKLREIDVWRSLGRADKVAEHEARIERAKARRKRARGYALLFLVAALAFGALAKLSEGWGETLVRETVTVEVEPTTLPESRTEAALVRLDTLDLGMLAPIDYAITATVTTTPPVDPPFGLEANVALVGPDSAAFVLDTYRSIVGPGEGSLTSSPHRFSDLRRPDAPVRLVLLVAREWKNYGQRQPWTETTSVPVTVEVRRVWMPGPFRSAFAVSLFFAFCFFLFSRSRVRE